MPIKNLIQIDNNTFDINIDDFTELNEDDVIAHEFGHVYAALGNLLVDFYFNTVEKDKTGHSEGNPSGDTSVSFQKKSAQIRKEGKDSKMVK